LAVVTSFSVITTGYAVLALIADAMVVVVVMGFLLTRTSDASRAQWTRFRDGVTPFALHFAWVVAMLATLGSLYLSQIAGDYPCEFCWFQRICMYPLSLLLGIAAFRGDLQVAKRYFITLPAVGAVLAIYHYQLEHVTNEPHGNCGPVSCSAPLFNIFGFISVPFLSMAAFLLIITLLLVARSRSDGEDAYLEDDDDEASSIESDDRTLPATA
jgi:disulfide bond formation protein DsbB